MEKEELIRRLKGYEWTDIEFKEARHAVPKNAYETVSAFANTDGGWLVFGIRDRTGDFDIVGVLGVDKVQNDFITTLRSGGKLSRIIDTKERLLEDDGKVLLVFHIPEARRQDKPVYLDGDIRRSFLRRGASNQRCTPTEIERLLKDAADERPDGQVVSLDPERCFDHSSVRWYRKRFDDQNPGHDETLSDLEFLHHWGLVVDVEGRLAPTHAAVLLFGNAPAFHQILSRPVVDWQWNRGVWSEETADERWADRSVIEDNLVNSWKSLESLYLKYAEKPFSVNPETLQRRDRPPDYIAFREAAINLLIHQDYTDHTRKPAIRIYDDRTIFWNPGDAFSSVDDLLDLGEKEIRNPRIVAAFRRIGLSEQAGTGIRAIVYNWVRLGRVPPHINNDRSCKAFELILVKEELLSEKQLLLQASLGVRLGDAEAKVFAFACREGGVNVRDVRSIARLFEADGRIILQHLTNQGLIVPVEGGKSSIFVIAEHIKQRLESQRHQQADGGACDPIADHPMESGMNLSTAQPDSDLEDLSTAQDAVLPLTDEWTAISPVSGPDLQTAKGVLHVESRFDTVLLTALSSTQKRIIEFCDTPRRLAEIMDALGVANRGYFKKHHLDPLLQGGVLQMVHPDQPNHPHQAYVLTKVGVEIKLLHMNKDSGSTATGLRNGQ